MPLERLAGQLGPLWFRLASWLTSLAEPNRAESVPCEYAAHTD